MSDDSHPENKFDPGKELIPLPVPELDATDNNETYLSRLNHYFTLSLSVPERAARALSAIVGGSTLLLTKTLIPGAIKNTNSYKFTLGMFQTFLIRNLAGLEHEDEGIVLKDKFVHRKMLGSSLEAAGLLTMHLSPVWVFAIASDAAKGGQVFLQRLVHQLKANNIIAQDSNPETLEQILLSIHDMGRHGATAIDTPPMTMDEVKELADELRRSTATITENSSNLLPRFEDIWNQISLVAKKENLSVGQILGMLSVHAANLTETGIGTAGAVGKTGYLLMDEVLLNDYKQTLSEIANTGAVSYMSDNMRPFLENAQSHFDFRQETWTQKWFRTAIATFTSKIRPDK